MYGKERTEIVFVLDRSGSMESIRKATLEGFNGFVSNQSALPGEGHLTLVLFDTSYTVAYSGVPLKEVVPLDEASYRPGGGTALLDALGTAIDRTGQRLAALPEAQRPGKVLVVVLTDGEENSSREYSVQAVRDRIEHQRTKYAWEILFLGANQDVFLTAGNLGVKEAIAFEASEEGTQEVYQLVSERVAALRESQ